MTASLAVFWPEVNPYSLACSLGLIRPPLPRRLLLRPSLRDGRRLFFLRDADDRVVRIPDAKGLESVRVVGLRADNGAGPAATANDNDKD